MPRIWIVSEDVVSRETLAAHLSAIGSVRSGGPDRKAWRDAEAPDLIALVPVESSTGDLTELERLLGFLRGTSHSRRAPAPVLYVEPPAGHPSAELACALIDDRPVARLVSPIDPDELLARAAALLDRPVLPVSLRERARREWVTQRVEGLYAGVDLPPLRTAIDPRNAARPVLLVGEPGTEPGLLARYVHNLAEPARDALVVLPAAALAEGEIERRILGRSASGRVSVYLEDLDQAAPELQHELAHVLAESGLLGIEPIRWIASARRSDRLVSRLRWLGWIRVDLPALRLRSDLPELAQRILDARAAVRGRRVMLQPDALARLARYAWPGNLRELEAVLEASLASSSGDALDAASLVIPPEASVEGIAPWAVTSAPEPLEPESVPEPRAAETADVEQVPLIEAEALPDAEISVEAAAEVAPLVAPAAALVSAEVPAPTAAAPSLSLAEVARPLGDELRPSLLALRTSAALLEQRPHDDSLRQNLSSRLGNDVARVENALSRLERFASFGMPKLAPVDLVALVRGELERQRGRMRERALVVLEELDSGAPAVLADAEQLRFALEVLLDRALRMVPTGGDLYLGSFHRAERGDAPARHRLLLRFHSPEEVLVAPDDEGTGAPVLEVVFARSLVERMGGTFAVDASGLAENLVVIEL